jgi:hypothetical protein
MFDVSSHVLERCVLSVTRFSILHSNILQTMFDRVEHAHARACARLVNEGTTVHARSGGYRACTRFARARATLQPRVRACPRACAHGYPRTRADARRTSKKWCATCDDAREPSMREADAKEPGSDEPGSSGAAPSRFELPLPP